MKTKYKILYVGINNSYRNQKKERNIIIFYLYFNIIEYVNF